MLGSRDGVRHILGRRLATAPGEAWTPTPALSPFGAGGQFIQVIPDLDLVVVITSDTDQDRSNPSS
jgi:hypothetical protein